MTAFKNFSAIFFSTAMVLALFSLCSCDFNESEDKDDECRIYIEDSSSSYDDYYIYGLYVAKSPNGNNGNWGDNIYDDYEILESRGWRMYRFAPGTYDLRVDHWSYTFNEDPYDTSLREYSETCRDGEGIKYEIDGNGNLFITEFTFSH